MAYITKGLPDHTEPPSVDTATHENSFSDVQKIAEANQADDFEADEFEDDVKFNFEDAISRQEEERLRLLQGVHPRKTPGDECTSASAHSGGQHHDAQNSRPVVCRHWVRGMCWKGDFCEFLHQYDTGKLPICRQFQRSGFCSDHERGACMYLHERTEDGPICLHYYLGFCRAGPRCRKRHQKAESSEDRPPLVPDWYLHLILENACSVVPKEIDPDTEAVLEEVERKCRQIAATDSTTAEPASQAIVAQTAVTRQESRHQQNNHHHHHHHHHHHRVRSDSSGLVDETVLKLSQEEGIPRLPASDHSPPVIRVFMIKSSDSSNIHKSIRLGIWATGKQNTLVLEQAFLSSDHVVLLFSANESGGFQGYARMMTAPLPGWHTNFWGTFSSRLGHNFRVQWLKQCRVEFERFGWLTNPLNDNQPIRKSRDCQELPVSLAAIICTVLNRQPDKDLLLGTDEEEKPKIDHESFFNLTETERREKEIELGIAPTTAIAAELVPSVASHQFFSIRPPPPPPQSSAHANGHAVLNFSNSARLILQRQHGRPYPQPPAAMVASQSYQMLQPTTYAPLRHDRQTLQQLRRHQLERYTYDNLWWR